MPTSTKPIPTSGCDSLVYTSYLISTVGLDVKRRTLPVTWPTLASVLPKPFVPIIIISTSSLSATSAILIDHQV